MERNLRFRVSGVIFFVIFISQLALSNSGLFNILSFIIKPPEQEPQVIPAIISALFLFFASEPIGYIFTSISLFVFNLFGGYAGLYSRKIGNLDKDIIDEYKNIMDTLPNDKLQKNFYKRIKNYNTEQFFIYFFWHRINGANDNLSSWVERRFTAFFISFSFLTSTIIALSSSIITIYFFNFGFNLLNLISFIISILLTVILAVNGEKAIDDAIAITDFHVASFINPIIQVQLKNHKTSEESTK